MAARTEHKFQFKASEIAAAARAEAEYHEGRVSHWAARRDAALARVTETARVKVTEMQVTGGTQANLVIDYGDPEAWHEYQVAYQKVQSHTAAAERYRTDQRVYATQADRAYELDTDDVHHFRLGGQPRED